MSSEMSIIDYSALCDVETEAIVLNTLMVSTGRERELALIALRDDYFSDNRLLEIFKTIKNLEERGYEATQESVAVELNGVDNETKKHFLAVLEAEVIPNPTLGVEKLKMWHQKRVVWRAAINSLKELEGLEAPKAIASNLIKEADSVLIEGEADTKSFAELEEMYKNEKPLPIYQTNIAFFDQRNKGLHAGQLVAVMGDPDAGKTSLVIQMLRNLTKAGHRVMFFPLEFSSRDMVEKTKWRKDFNKELFLLEDRFTDLYDIESEIKKQALKGVKIFAIDSQMVVNVPGGGFDNAAQREAEKFRVLQRLAIAYELVILFVCQQSNAHSEGGIIRPMGSKHAAHYVHAIWFIKKPKLEFNKDGEEKNKGYREFMQVKAKGGGGYFKVDVEIDRKLDFRGIRPKKDNAYTVEFEDKDGHLEKTVEVPLI